MDVVRYLSCHSLYGQVEEGEKEVPLLYAHIVSCYSSMSSLFGYIEAIRATLDGEGDDRR